MPISSTGSWGERRVEHHRKRRQGPLWRAARHPDARGALPAHPGRHGQRHDLAVPGALPRRARREPRESGAAGRARAAAGFHRGGAQDLVRLGAEAITTNCGFLSLFQQELAAAAGVPVATSSLMQVPWVQATLPPGKRVGVVTVSGSTLTPQHLEAAGVPLDTPFVGTENGREFFRVLIKGEKDDMDVALAEQDIVDAGQALVAQPSGHRRHRARMHQHAAVCRRAAGRGRPAGLRHLFDDHVVPRRPPAAGASTGWLQPAPWCRVAIIPLFMDRENSSWRANSARAGTLKDVDPPFGEDRSLRKRDVQHLLRAWPPHLISRHRAGRLPAAPPKSPGASAPQPMVLLTGLAVRHSQPTYQGIVSGPEPSSILWRGRMMSTSRSSWWPSFTATLAYAVAILAVAAALVAALLIDGFLQTTPYVSLVSLRDHIRRMVRRPWSVCSATLATVLFTYFFVDPGGSLDVAPKDLPRVALFATTALFVVSLSAAQRRNADSLRFARDELQATVQELARVNRALEAENAQRRRVRSPIWTRLRG